MLLLWVKSNGVLGIFFPLVSGSALLAPHLTFCFIIDDYSGSSCGLIFGKQPFTFRMFPASLKITLEFHAWPLLRGPKREGCHLDADWNPVSSVSLPVSAGSSVPQRVCWAPFTLGVAINKGGKTCCGFPSALFHSLQADEEGRGSSPWLFLVPHLLSVLLEPPAPPALITAPITSEFKKHTSSNTPYFVEISFVTWLDSQCPVNRLPLFDTEQICGSGWMEPKGN